MNDSENSKKRDKQREKRSYSHKAKAISYIDIGLNNDDYKDYRQLLKMIRTEVNKI